MEESQRGSRALYVQPLALALVSLNFSLKEPLNRLRNPITSWIPVCRISQIFRLQLTDDFGPFNFKIWTFGKLQSCSPLT